VRSRRIPYVSNIPILGALFRFDREIESRSELLVVMTPMVISGDEDLEYVKHVESSRMSWCLADIVEMHGDVGLSGGYGLWGPAVGPVIYPDLQPTVDDFPPLYIPGEFPMHEGIPHDGKILPGTKPPYGESVIPQVKPPYGESVLPPATPPYGETEVPEVQLHQGNRENAKASAVQPAAFEQPAAERTVPATATGAPQRLPTVR
jgi:general secretion pathway protein D